MAATASDVRDALSLPAASTSAVPAGPTLLAPRKAAGGGRKPEGVSRELFSLIGDAAPTLVPTLARSRFKSRPDISRTKARWELRTFKHSGRRDGLQLKHWTKVAPKKKGGDEAEYPFAKFGKPSTILEYTDDEYALWLEDAEWTKEETDYLMSLIKDYDARFYVVSDRYEYGQGVQRSIEDLKHRYYSICRKLLRNRELPPGVTEAARAELVQSYVYDRDRETARKAYVQGLLSRTPEQIAEEDMLFLVAKKLEQNERRFARDRDELLRNLAGIDSGLPNLRVDEEPFTALGALPAMAGGAGGGGGGGGNKRKRKSEAAELDSPSGTPTVVKKINLARQAVDDDKHCIIRTDGGSLTTPATKAAHQPVYLRSARIPQPKTTNAAKIQAALTELGINFARLVMPTRDTLAHLETLLEAAGQYVEAKRTLDKIDHEIRVLKQKKGEIDEGDAISNA